MSFAKMIRPQFYFYCPISSWRLIRKHITKTTEEKNAVKRTFLQRFELNYFLRGPFVVADQFHFLVNLDAKKKASINWEKLRVKLCFSLKSENDRLNTKSWNILDRNILYYWFLSVNDRLLLFESNDYVGSDSFEYTCSCAIVPKQTDISWSR